TGRREVPVQFVVVAARAHAVARAVLGRALEGVGDRERHSVTGPGLQFAFANIAGGAVAAVDAQFQGGEVLGDGDLGRTGEGDDAGEVGGGARGHVDRVEALLLPADGVEVLAGLGDRRDGIAAGAGDRGAGGLVVAQ